MVVFPFIEDDFIACEKGTDFMGKLIEAYFDVLVNGWSSESLSKLDTDRYLIGFCSPAKTEDSK